MSGQTNLQETLDSMAVSCDEVKYGFANTSIDTGFDPANVLCTFKEEEGLTLIAPSDYLDSMKVTSEGPYAKLTVEVHTSLELVGLTAVLASKLAEQEISANVVAAYFHDHVFVQYNKRHNAIEALNSLKTGN